MGEVTIIGVDLARSKFRVHCAAADGIVQFRKKLSRPQFARSMAEQPPCLVALRPAPAQIIPGELQSRLCWLARRTTWQAHDINKLRLGDGVDVALS